MELESSQTSGQMSCDVVAAVTGAAYEEPRLTCWYGELPYTYARSTLSANTQVLC